MHSLLIVVVYIKRAVPGYCGKVPDAWECQETIHKRVNSLSGY